MAEEVSGPTSLDVSPTSPRELVSLEVSVPASKRGGSHGIFGQWKTNLLIKVEQPCSLWIYSISMGVLGLGPTDLVLETKGRA